MIGLLLFLTHKQIQLVQFFNDFYM